MEKKRRPEQSEQKEDGQLVTSDQQQPPERRYNLSWLKQPTFTTSSTASPPVRPPALFPEADPATSDPSPSVHVKLPLLRTIKNSTNNTTATSTSLSGSSNGGSRMIELVLNDRLGKKVRVKCNSDDTVGVLKRLAAAQLGTQHDRLVIKKWYTIYKDHVRLDDYEIHDGMGLELYYK